MHIWAEPPSALRTAASAVQRLWLRFSRRRNCKRHQAAASDAASNVCVCTDARVNNRRTVACLASTAEISRMPTIAIKASLWRSSSLFSQSSPCLRFISADHGSNMQGGIWSMAPASGASLNNLNKE